MIFLYFYLSQILNAGLLDYLEYSCRVKGPEYFSHHRKYIAYFYSELINQSHFDK